MRIRYFFRFEEEKVMPKETEGFGMLDGKTYFVLSTYNIQKTTFIF